MDVLVTRPNGVEELVDDSLLDRTEGQEENDDQITKWVEYRFKDRPDHLAHRSVHVILKRWPAEMGILQGAFN